MNSLLQGIPIVVAIAITWVVWPMLTSAGYGTDLPSILTNLLSPNFIAGSLSVILLGLFWLSSVFFTRLPPFQPNDKLKFQYQFTWKIVEDITLDDLKFTLKNSRIDVLWLTIQVNEDNKVVVPYIQTAGIPTMLTQLIIEVSKVESLQSIFISATNKESPSAIAESIAKSKKPVVFVKNNGQGISLKGHSTLHTWSSETSSLPTLLRFLHIFYHTGLLPFIPFNDAGIILREGQLSQPKHNILIHHLVNRMVTIVWLDQDVSEENLETLRSTGFHGVVVETQKDVKVADKWLKSMLKKKQELLKQQEGRKTK
ncbi:hypothetical protein HK098_001664 [Nowakowskiella sp. JEL0407]|nr:hypothetical protein HK098_001664 [Nowakowskiella sp. JEL0407]